MAAKPTTGTTSHIAAHHIMACRNSDKEKRA
jgi:hypothetical protein